MLATKADRTSIIGVSVLIAMICLSAYCFYIAKHIDDSPGKLAYKAGNYDKAITLLNKALSSGPDSTRMQRYYLGMAYYKRHDYKDAEQQLYRYLYDDNGYSLESAHYYLGRCYQRRGDYPNALVEYTRVENMRGGKGSGSNPFIPLAQQQMASMNNPTTPKAKPD